MKMTRDDIKKGPIYFRQPDLDGGANEVRVWYRSDENLLNKEPEDDGYYLNGKSQNLLYLRMEATKTLDELIEEALESIIDGLELSPGLDHVLSLEELPVTRFQKLIRKP